MLNKMFKNKHIQPSLKRAEIVAHMKTAYVYAQLSYCEKKKVGCVVVKDDRIISIGYNGAPSGWENVCEDCNGNTLASVYHAEANAITKLAKCSESGYDASVFVTCTPCYDCAKLLSQTKIKELYYGEHYTSSTNKTKGNGLEHLHQCNIPTFHIQL